MRLEQLADRLLLVNAYDGLPMNGATDSTFTLR